WGGRFISDSTLSSAVKSARRAVGDDGAAQAVIKTVHGRGFRFVAPLRAPARSAAPDPADAPPLGAGRPSLAVMRFLPIGGDARAGAIADAIPAELISWLSRLRWARIIARGSTFQFAPETLEPTEIGRKLGVRYVMAGSVEAVGAGLSISIELIFASSGELVWSDRFACGVGEVHVARRDIVAAAIAAMELEVPSFEADAARHLGQEQFDAWSHHHLGLRHIYRYNRADNVIAARHFERAIELDPGLARAHAGRSLAHWQDAFMHYGADRATPLRRAIEAAERGLAADDRDPFSNFSMGRAIWLQGDAEAGLPWLSRALRVNPNYAQCCYAQGLAQILAGDAERAQASARQAIDLSPLDPLRYGMLGVIAMCRIAEREFATAARVADEATRSPGAHFYIMWIAALAHELAGDRAAAEARLNLVRAERPDISPALFFGAFPFAGGDAAALLTASMSRLGVV
ncbi:MAG: transcriptional regulator, partial [Pseudomonadota bacterium]